MMKLGLVSAILPDDTFEHVIDYAQASALAVLKLAVARAKAARRYAGITHIRSRRMRR